MFNFIEENIKKFNPYWFFSNIATSLLALITFYLKSEIPFGNELSLFFSYFSLLMFFSLLFLFIAKFFRYNKKFLNHINNPKEINAFYLLPIAILIFSITSLELHTSILSSIVFWLIGFALVFFLSIYLTYKIYINKKVKVSDFNGSFLLLPFSLILISLSASFICSYIMIPSFYFISFLALGAGVLLYIPLFVISFYRFIFEKPHESNYVSLLWMDMAIISSIILGIYFLGIPLLFIFSILLWGFALWWFILMFLITLHYIKYLNLLKEQWWAIILPISFFILATYHLNSILPYNIFYVIGVPLYIVTLSIWISDILKVVLWRK